MTARLLLSCGEPSGDLYAGALTRALRALDPAVAVSGLGGPHFAAAGGELIADYRGLAVTGLTEALGKLPQSFATLRRLTAAARAALPDALIAVDFPDFNFRLARRLKGLGVPVIYYVSPQIWAWRPGRLKTMRKIADQVLVIFPFEEPMYREAGVPVRFVGHPLVDLVGAPGRPPFLERFRAVHASPLVAILPGSRTNEVRRLLPILVAAARRIRRRLPTAQFVVARAPGLDDRLFDLVRQGQIGPDAIVEGETDLVLAAADVALTASGTATVQAALHDTPMVIVYRVSPLTYYIGRRLVIIRTFGMVNLIAGSVIAPELIQGDFTAAAVAAEAVSILTDASRRAHMREGLADVRRKLGGPGASRRAAEAILEIVERRKGEGLRAQS